MEASRNEQWETNEKQNNKNKTQHLLTRNENGNNKIKSNKQIKNGIWEVGKWKHEKWESTNQRNE